MDVDNNKVLFSEEMDDIKLVPPSLLAPLLQSLQYISKEIRSLEASQFSLLGSLMGKPKPKERKPLSKPLVKDIQNLFIGFMVDLLANYKIFMRKTSVTPPPSSGPYSVESSFNTQFFDREGSGFLPPILLSCND